MTALYLIFLIYSSSLLAKDGASVEIEVGKSLDLLKNYGLLMGVFPSDLHHYEFLHNEFFNIFDKNISKSVLQSSQSYSNVTWNAIVCENGLQVLNEIFSNYRIDFVDNKRGAFSTFWPLKVLAEFIGLNQSFFTNNNYAFLLVKHNKCNAQFYINNEFYTDVAFDAKFLEAIERITVGDSRSVLTFISQYGSHYVASYLIGSIIYQVHYFPSRYYQCFSTYCNEDCQLEILLQKCTNGLQIKRGRVKTLSDLKILEERLNELLVTIDSAKKHEAANIFNFKQTEISTLLNICEDENLVLSAFNLVSINNVISDKNKAKFVREVIDNQMKLRELFL